MAYDLQKKLDSLTVDELRTHVRNLKIDRVSSLRTKQLLINSLLECNHPRLRRSLRMTWIDSHRLGIIIGIVSVALTVVGLVAQPFKTATAKPDNVKIVSKYGYLKISVDRRNAVQNSNFDRWIDRTVSFRQRYVTGAPPTKNEYDLFIAEFIEFAEHNFTRSQIDWFNKAFGSGCGIERVTNFKKLEREMQEQTNQLGLIEWYLKDFVDFNCKNEKPESPRGL